MRVKKLEIVGFKSFANKTAVHFEPGVTAIVGPNGSGKTNVVDAVRWVLGEHNPRDIRAPRLEDVIFNGTDRQAPLSMAEVQLTIGNEQGMLPISFTDVTITRRVYRSGESECLINGSPCRLKDIQELFLGTGLGGGTYAIIEQGHIDLILSSKPEERRVVFEEASGVAKYLAKKAETMRRLDEVEEHLLRIADIVGEVRRQVGALERAANKARQYKTQWEQLKGLELRLAVDELRSGESRHRELETALQTLNVQREELEAQKQGRLTSLESCNASVSAMQQRLQALRTAAVECASQIQQHESQQTLKTRWVEALKAQMAQAEREEAELRARLAQVEEQFARTSGGETEIQAQLAANQEGVDRARADVATVELSLQAALDAMEAAKAQVFEAASEASQQRNQLAEVTSRLHALDAQLARLEETGTRRAGELERVQARHGACFEERLTLQAECELMQRRLAATHTLLDAAGVRRHELTGRLHQSRERLASERARVQLLEDLWRRYEGFPDTVKTLMARSIEGLIGPLVDVVQARPGHEEIVEAALGPLADALVVRDRTALRRCREAVGSEQLESCRFLVLSDCPGRLPPMEAPNNRIGVAAAVKEFIQADAAYQPLVDWLLNDSWVVKDIQGLLDDHQVPQARLVTAQGDRWDRRSWRFTGSRTASHTPACAARSGGDCTCGAAGRRLGRKQRWEDARAGLRAIEEEVAQLQAQADEAAGQWSTLLNEQEAVKNQLSQGQAGFHKLEASLGQLAHELQRVRDDEHARALEAQDLTGQKEELRATLGGLQRTVADAEARQAAIDRALTEAQAARQAAESRRQEGLITIAQIESGRQTLLERAGAIKARGEELQADRSRLLQDIDGKATQRVDATARIAEFTGQLEEHGLAIGRLQQERVQREGDVEAATSTLRAEEVKRDQVLPHLLAVEQELSSLVQKIQEGTREASERTFRRSRVVERLQELYHIDEATLLAEEHAQAPPLTEEQRTALSQQVQALRAKLEGMGPVSLGSVEEYDELKRRHEFLLSQQQDLTRSRDDLKTSITQINRTARAQFRETFERITQEFQHYFTRLFNGGEANLILMDEEDVLESGIDIVARPPGKRLQSISLLSGGERALTAIALLFALFKVRPSPFCILDEIDAPLDEANVDRFTRVLEEFLELSQFILITHNKKTITKADSLYGVTMEEAGVSKILSAKLTKTNGTPAAARAVGS